MVSWKCAMTLRHRLNVETALLPVKAEPEIQLKATQCCLCYCQNLLNQLSWFYYKKSHLVIQKQLSPL